MNIFFSAVNPGFYPGADRDYYELHGTWPADAVKLTDAEVGTFWKKIPPEGKQLGSSGGRPAWVNVQLTPMTTDLVRSMRLLAYRAETDPLKMEAEHDAIVSGTAPDYTTWIAKVAEVKARLPLP
jgi:hypothetical protein